MISLIISNTYVASCCCNTVAFQLSMLCMKCVTALCSMLAPNTCAPLTFFNSCQQDQLAGDQIGIDAGMWIVFLASKRRTHPGHLLRRWRVHAVSRQLRCWNKPFVSFCTSLTTAHNYGINHWNADYLRIFKRAFAMRTSGWIIIYMAVGMMAHGKFLGYDMQHSNVTHRYPQQVLVSIARVQARLVN